MKTDTKSKQKIPMAITFDAPGTSKRDDAVWCQKTNNGYMVLGYITATDASLDAKNDYLVIRCELRFDSSGKYKSCEFDLTKIYIAANYSFSDQSFLRNGGGSRQKHNVVVNLLDAVATANQNYIGVEEGFHKRSIEWLMSGINMCAGQYLEKHAVFAIFSNRVILRHTGFVSWAQRVFEYYADGLFPESKEDRLKNILSGEWFRAEQSVGCVSRRVYGSAFAQVTSPLRQEIDCVNLNQMLALLSGDRERLFGKKRIVKSLKYVDAQRDPRSAPIRA